MASEQELRFHWADYFIFALTLLMSSAIGVFYGWRDRKDTSTEGFLMAGRSMHFLPVSVSLFVSWISAISFLGDPVEVYYHGAVYWVIGIGYALALPLIVIFFVPLYYRMKLTSAYQYLEERFSARLRPICSILTGSCLMLYLGIALFAPAVALSQVSGLQVWISMLTVGSVCVFYTTLGGMKAVLWADTAQMVIMLGGILAVIIQGTISVGGMGKVWQIAEDGGRINFNFNPNPLVRSTFWSYVIGGFFRVLSPYSAEQYFIQRYCSAKSLKHARIAVLLTIPMYLIFPTLFTFLGLLMYAHFHDCDPLANGDIMKPDQMLPLLVLRVLGFLPGLPGLFLACIFSAALSTISSGQNGLATMCLHDVVMKVYRQRKGEEMKDSTAKVVAKILCLFLGIINIGVGFLIYQLSGESIFQLSLRIVGMFLGPITGMFIVGVLMPFVNTVGITIGFLSSLAITLWLGIGATFFAPPPVNLGTSVSGCDVINATSHTTTSVYDLNSTNSSVPDDGFQAQDLYGLSAILFVAIGPIMTALFSAIATGVHYIVCGRRGKEDSYNVQKPDESTEWCLEKFPVEHKDMNHQQMGHQPSLKQPLQQLPSEF
ncbi:hypothetical protein CAPTEDRAFT_177302 [Capitella teleta]|uniref:Uncharacterized protein n=1 Tax=Capitella teleta TaxID=283909 RepID=R7T965_CAPTE|nr:hypothetical protein CAPTEDRAFT_177302 [Capitella teleta]|eukprot:ELT90273.1 hypothetical protein CAPTEDRAFT_177302 [Capitella teleta]